MNGSLTFGYDAFNRLTSMSGSKGDTYGYDRYGNRWNKGTGSNLTFGADNRIGSASSFAYDAAGNVLWDGFYSYCYDAENRLLRAVDDSNGAANPCDTSKSAVGVYSYDPSGLRVKATINGSTYDYVYDLAGRQIAQWDATNGRARGELYVGSMHLASFTPTETYFLHTDQVGTVRALTTHDGTVASKCPSSPWGDGFSCNTPVKTLFTDYERDGETGLDHSWFRQYSSRAGRYHSPDPVRGTPEDPQSWNRYAYVRGNPVAYTDPLGRNLFSGWCDASCDGGGSSWGFGGPIFWRSEDGRDSYYFDMSWSGGARGGTTWDGDLVSRGGFGPAAAEAWGEGMTRYLMQVDAAFANRPDPVLLAGNGSPVAVENTKQQAQCFQQCEQVAESDAKWCTRMVTWGGAIVGGAGKAAVVLSNLDPEPESKLIGFVGGYALQGLGFGIGAGGSYLCERQKEARVSACFSSCSTPRGAQ